MDDALSVAFATIERIRQRGHDQTSWRDCFAGIFAELDPFVKRLPSDSPAARAVGLSDMVMIIKNGQAMHVSQWVVIRLGLDPGEVTHLFMPDNTIDDLEAGIKALANGESLSHAVIHHRAERGAEDVCETCDEPDDGL